MKNLTIRLDELVAAGDLQATTVPLVESYATTWGVSVVEALLDCHIYSEEDLAIALGKILEIPVFYDEQELMQNLGQKAELCLTLKEALASEIALYSTTGGGFEVVIWDPLGAQLSQIMASYQIERVFALAPRQKLRRWITEGSPLDSKAVEPLLKRRL